MQLTQFLYKIWIFKAKPYIRHQANIQRQVCTFARASFLNNADQTTSDNQDCSQSQHLPDALGR